RGGLELPRPRDPAADAKPGPDARPLPGDGLARLVAADHPGRGHHAARPGVQPGRGPAPRRARPATARGRRAMSEPGRHPGDGAGGTGRVSVPVAGRWSRASVPGTGDVEARVSVPVDREE